MKINMFKMKGGHKTWYFSPLFTCSVQLAQLRNRSKLWAMIYNSYKYIIIWSVCNKRPFAASQFVAILRIWNFFTCHFFLIFHLSSDVVFCALKDWRQSRNVTDHFDQNTLRWSQDVLWVKSFKTWMLLLEQKMMWLPRMSTFIKGCEKPTNIYTFSIWPYST